MHELFPEPVSSWIRVAVDRPIDVGGDGLTYAAGPDLGELQPGDPVVVPLGRGNARTGGWVVAECERPRDTAAIKHVLARGETPPIPQDLVALGRWMARYYLAPLGPTLSGLVPAPVKRGTGGVVRRMLEPVAAAEPPARLGPAQRTILDVIGRLAPNALPIERKTLRDLAGVATYGPIDALVRHGLLTETKRTDIATAWQPHHLDVAAAPTPTEDQHAVINAIADSLGRGFHAHVLRGVTGSGKTEVYLRLIEQVLAAAGSVLVLVPEIALTPQTASRLAARFPSEQLAIMHSALPAAARHAHWQAARRGDARIVLGARSGVFAPIPPGKLGLIVVDEEHDASFKQDAAPRYHGRDVAIRRAATADCPILLCSATPSLETWHNAQARPDWSVHRLARRAPGLTVPRTRVVDIRKEIKADPGCGSIGPTLRAALHRTLDEGHQALLLLNRRGWATLLACADRRCGWSLQCDHCDVTMVFHRGSERAAPGFLRCHHCHREVRQPRTCPECGGRVLRQGAGTQRVEEDVLAMRPDLEEGHSLIRMDSDSMQHIDRFQRVLSRFQSGEVRVLLGTQMIAKGLDVPGVRLVGVIDADTSMHMPDFRASERTFQLISQVTGRCGRSETAGDAIVQTRDPDAPSIVLAAAGQAERFLESELAQRHEAGLPPATRMARVLIADEQLTRCDADAARLADAIGVLAGPGDEIMGPMPCPIPRIRARHRREVLLTSPNAGSLQRWVHAALGEGLLAAPTVSVDIDPISLL
ncbi:MAG: primosomal protein N' [Phycisphaerales bacterium]|nr:primosomal protein N' [Phycisphaerales bacterium]